MVPSTRTQTISPWILVYWKLCALSDKLVDRVRLPGVVMTNLSFGQSCSIIDSGVYVYVKNTLWANSADNKLMIFLLFFF